MRFALASATIATLATTVLAVNIQIDVGLNGLNYTPPSVTALVGDTIEFIFHPKNHTATQSSFASPCQPIAGGFDSGFNPVSPNTTALPSVTVMVNDTTPLWFYCMQSNHCEQGMVFAVNPTANNTFAAFQAAAEASLSNVTSASGAPTSSSGTGLGSGYGYPETPSGTATGGSSAATSTPPSSPNFNGAVAVGARAGGILAVVGFAAAILL